MPSKTPKFKSFLIGLLTTILIVACQNNSVRQSANSQLRDCRIVQHSLDEVCVPKTPQRLISLDHITFADALSLKVPSVGISTYDARLPNYLAEKIGNVELLGKSEQPHLEKIYQLNPDLIMGLELNGESIFQQLSQIAPTAVGEWNGYPDWRNHFNFVARILGKEAQAKIVWDNYNLRIKELQMALSDRLQNIEIGIGYIYLGGLITIDAENSFSGSILNDAGIRRPESQAAIEGGTIGLAEERILDLDADILFISVYNHEESKRVLADLQKKPLWNRLKAVQNQQVYLVNMDIWRGGNPIAANLVIADLYKYLVDNPTL